MSTSPSLSLCLSVTILTFPFLLNLIHFLLPLFLSPFSFILSLPLSLFLSPFHFSFPFSFPPFSPSFFLPLSISLSFPSFFLFHYRNLIVGTTTGIILVTIFIGGGLTVPLVKWLNIKSNVDHAAYVREVLLHLHSFHFPKFSTGNLFLIFTVYFFDYFDNYFAYILFSLCTYSDSWNVEKKNKI